MLGMLTDLEGAVLAVIARDGATTSYKLAREFASSPSQFWSGSSGAIYPLMARLRRRELVVGKPDATGRRKATSFSITIQGRRELETWLLDVDRAADMGFDPLRTRLIFLHLVPAAERAGFLDEVARRTAELSLRIAADEDLKAREHSVSWLNMRLAWLRKFGASAGSRSG
jgi:DNA-binding PadR family transcriptional regulator